MEHEFTSHIREKYDSSLMELYCCYISPQLEIAFYPKKSRIGGFSSKPPPNQKKILLCFWGTQSRALRVHLPLSPLRSIPNYMNWLKSSDCESVQYISAVENWHITKSDE